MLPPPSTSEAQEAPSPDDMQVPEAEPKQISECQTEDAADRSSVQIDATDVRDAMRDVIEEPVLVVDLDPKNDWGYKGGYREEGKNKKTETDSEYTVILSD